MSSDNREKEAPKPGRLPDPVENRRHDAINPCGACPVRGLAVCGVLEPDELRQLAELVHEIDYSKQQTVFLEGDDEGGLFIVTHGVAMIYKLLADGRRQVTGFLYPGDHFGIAIAGKHAYSVEAVTELSLCRFQRNQFEDLLERFPKLERRLLRESSNELVANQEQMMLLGRKTAIEKVASFLISLSRRRSVRPAADGRLWIPMRRSDIGDYLGLTTETTSRMLTQLKARGLIALGADHRVEILDHESLEIVAQGE